MNVKDRVAIVTGASSGIGLATARLLWTRGARLALVARSKDKLDRLTEQLPGSIAVPTDMTSVDDIVRMVGVTASHFGRIDVLVNCAGQGYDASLEETDIEVLRHVFELDLVGPVFAMQRVIPFMRKQGGGAIVNVSSGLALMVIPGMGGYGGLKRALAHMSLAAREELEKDRIAVSVVYPYITLTEFENRTIKPPSTHQRGPGREGEEEREGGEGHGPPFPPDTAEYAAEKVVEAVESGEGEVFAHDWMRKMGEAGDEAPRDG
ncbi:MAG: SDR family oxidoreductase [Nitrososphaerales archaeon]|jgi:short-subunit dehydrogenase